MKKNKKKPPKVKKPSLILTRKAVFGWVCFIFFLSAWMFAVGVLVGRETFPLKLYRPNIREKLETSKGDDKSKENSPLKKDSAKEDDKTGLEFYEVLPQGQEDIDMPAEPKSSLIRKSVEPPPEKTAAVKKDKSPPKKAASVKKRTKKASPKKKVAADSKTASAQAVYTIQVASVKNMKDADQMVARLKKKGYPAYRTIAKIPGKGIWFRVRVGGYRSQAEAGNTMQKLRKARLKPMIVKK